MCVFQLLDNSANKHTEQPKFFSCFTSGLCSLAKYTKLCMVWQPNTCNMLWAFGGGRGSPAEPPTRGSAPGPHWGTSVPQNPLHPSAGNATAIVQVTCLYMLEVSNLTSVSTSAPTSYKPSSPSPPDLEMRPVLHLCPCCWWLFPGSVCSQLVKLLLIFCTKANHSQYAMLEKE